MERKREERRRGRERRREKEVEEDPSCDGKISIMREGSHAKAYAQRKISVAGESGRRKTSREERRGRKRERKGEERKIDHGREG